MSAKGMEGRKPGYPFVHSPCALRESHSLSQPLTELFGKTMELARDQQLSTSYFFLAETPFRIMTSPQHSTLGIQKG